MISVHTRNLSISGLSNGLEEKEIVHTWVANEFKVSLFTSLGTLNYETIDTTKNDEVVYIHQGIDMGQKSIEQMVARFKSCRIKLEEDGSAVFLRDRGVWTVGDDEIHLLEGVDDLTWDVVSGLTGRRSLFSFKECTVASTRCHSETVALVEKIKAAALHIDYLENDFMPMRILDTATFKEERTQLLKTEAADLERSISSTFSKSAWSKFTTGVGSLSGIGTGTTAVVLSVGAIKTAAIAVSAVIGGGIPGLVVGGYTAFIMGLVPWSIGAGIGAAPFGAVVDALRAGDADDRRELASLRKRIQAIDSLEMPLVFEIEPKSVPSLIDDRACVSKCTWAVTLFTGPEGASRNHAIIIVEGINDGFVNCDTPRIDSRIEVVDGEYFVYKSEFKPPIESGICDHEAASIYDKRSVVWMVTADKVKKMLNAIKEESGLSRGHCPRINILGIESKVPSVIPSSIPRHFPKLISKSIVEHGHSCFTWAREKLQIVDIELGESALRAVITWPKSYTQTVEAHSVADYQVQI